jgi:hypothetical protein
MASQKRSISFDESVLQEAERRLAHAGGNLSAFVNAAVLHELQVTQGRELLAEDARELGEISGKLKSQVTTEWPA